MAGNIQIRFSDMFRGACDLIVLPCSTDGGITQIVYNKLKAHGIDFPPSQLNLGDVIYSPFNGGENIAQYYAFAASVKNRDSEISAIEAIGKQLGEITATEQSIKVIHAPLLGAGAGGLDALNVALALKKGFLSTAVYNSNLVIHCIDKLIFERLKSYFENSIPQNYSLKNKENIRLFISWTVTSDEHRNWVENLAKFLRDNGVNVRLVIWHLRRGMDLPQFMTNELGLAQKVLIISNEQYAEKADGRLGGVGWETMIIQGDMARQKPDSTKYLVLAKCNQLDLGVPQYLKTKYLYHWSTQLKENAYRNELLSDLFNIIEEPPIGISPLFIS